VHTFKNLVGLYAMRTGREVARTGASPGALSQKGALLRLDCRAQRSCTFRSAKGSEAKSNRVSWERRPDVRPQSMLSFPPESSNGPPSDQGSGLNASTAEGPLASGVLMCAPPLPTHAAFRTGSTEQEGCLCFYSLLSFGGVLSQGLRLFRSLDKALFCGCVSSCV
jgi:hypothetical protein